jgi:hypothetical protein
VPLFPTAGARLFIGGLLAQKTTDFVASDFSGQSQLWTEIKHLENLGAIGDQAEEVSIGLIDQQRVKRFKGARQSAPLELTFGLDVDDLGQIALIAAERSRDDFAFKIEFPDAPAGGTPSQRLFIGIVGSATETYDTANSVTRLGAQVWINSNIVRVASAPPPPPPED